MALGWGIAWGMGVHRGDSPNIMILLTAIICENTTCLTINRWYHYDCVGIIEEPETWVCEGCTSEVEDNEYAIRYCLCKKTEAESLNENLIKRIGSDCGNCRVEWFHYKCVGIKQKPKKDWICPECLAQPSTSDGT